MLRRRLSRPCRSIRCYPSGFCLQNPAEGSPDIAETVWLVLLDNPGLIVVSEAGSRPLNQTVDAGMDSRSRGWEETAVGKEGEAPLRLSTDDPAREQVSSAPVAGATMQGVRLVERIPTLCPCALEILGEIRFAVDGVVVGHDDDDDGGGRGGGRGGRGGRFFFFRQRTGCEGGNQRYVYVHIRMVAWGHLP